MFWKRNIRKRNYERGEQHINSAQKLVNARELQPSCNENCFFKCNENLSHNGRQEIINSYYECDNSGQKAFIIRSVEKAIKSAKNNKNSRKLAQNNDKSLRNYSFKYHLFLGNEKIRVCKKFYLETLNISQTVIYNAHHKKNIISGNPLPSKAGKHIKMKISDEKRNSVIEHINSFPKVESHYRRAQTSKDYFESSLNLLKIYDLYEEKCLKSTPPKIPVKVSFYRHIFNTEFNIDFIKPKNDRCDICEKNKTDANNDNNYENHLLLKNSVRTDRNNDRKNEDLLTVCFDLQRVITCPQSFVNNLYYKRKIAVYNLTAHESISKTVYCALWDESVCGRSGNDIASAIFAILEKICEKYSNISAINLWCDS